MVELWCDTLDDMLSRGTIHPILRPHFRRRRLRTGRRSTQSTKQHGTAQLSKAHDILCSARLYPYGQVGGGKEGRPQHRPPSAPPPASRRHHDRNVGCHDIDNPGSSSIGPLNQGGCTIAPHAHDWSVIKTVWRSDGSTCTAECNARHDWDGGRVK